MTASPIYYDIIPSPIGPMMLVADDDGLRELRFELDYRPQTPLDGWVHAPEKLAQVHALGDKGQLGINNIADDHAQGIGGGKGDIQGQKMLEHPEKQHVQQRTEPTCGEKAQKSHESCEGRFSIFLSISNSLI